MSLNQTFLSAVFSDETPRYRFPLEPDPGDTVTIRLRVAKGSAKRAVILFDSLPVGSLMRLERSDEFFDYYESAILCNEQEVTYRFVIECADGSFIAYDKCGVPAEVFLVVRSASRRIGDRYAPS